MTEAYDIYFDSNKIAYAYEIKGYICKIKSDLWSEYAGTDKWDIVNNKFVDISDTEEYKEKKAKEEKERVGKLTCTKRVFALMLQELGIDYLKDLKPLIESNSQAQLEWELCVELQRNNPLIDTMAAKLKITSEQLDSLFKCANNEITKEQFKAGK